MNSQSELIIQNISMDEIKINLINLSNRSLPRSDKTHSLLKGLLEPITILVKKGIPFNEISEILKSYDINVTGTNIHEFFLVEQLQRDSKINPNYEKKYRKPINGSSRPLTQLENELRNAIHKNEGLFLVYQPQINVSTGKIVGAEALVRWKYKGVIIQPNDFISIAERSDLIIDLGDWILNEACREAKRWNALSLGGDKPIKISVNLSVKQLIDKLPDIVSSIMRENKLAPGSLGLEITESFMLKDNAFSVLKKIKDNGISLSIDDFGTGYSCLSTLRHLPFDVLKIDKSFVENIETEYRSIMMIEFIVNLAKKFEMTTIAEGVERPEQFKILRDMGCNVCQGFYFSKGITGNDFIRFIDQGISEAFLR